MIAPPRARKQKVGEIRPSQLLYSFGVGAVIDLPYLSTLVMGLDDWQEQYARLIEEERVLAAVQTECGEHINRLMTPPVWEEESQSFNAGPAPAIGVPVSPFPRWMLCPACRLLTPLNSGLFTLKSNPFHPDRAQYIHANCTKRLNQVVLPARFLVACDHGHLDDFPWDYFIHQGQPGCSWSFRLDEFGVSGDAASIQVKCETCGAKRRMSDAFGMSGLGNLPSCSGRHPHLRRTDDEPCQAVSKTILLGASNSWFPVLLSALSIPRMGNPIEKAVDGNWSDLHDVEGAGEIRRMLQRGNLNALIDYSPEAIWAAVESRRDQAAPAKTDPTDLKGPEWRVFAELNPERNSDDFLLRTTEPPLGYEHYFEEIVLAERLRRVEALIGFTRIESPRAFDGADPETEDNRAPLSRGRTTWIPAVEVRGEGLFLRFREELLQAWEQRLLGSIPERFAPAAREWQQRRGLQPAGQFDGGFFRTLLLHSFAHVLMRQLSLESGYSVASINERIYALPPEDPNGPMGGLLLYTAAPDSEGTLGGLVALGDATKLGRMIDDALGHALICSSDPYCSEHNPNDDAWEKHWAACHACLFVPETSCERGNRFLDRSVLVKTFAEPGEAFFSDPTTAR